MPETGIVETSLPPVARSSGNDETASLANGPTIGLTITAPAETRYTYRGRHSRNHSLVSDSITLGVSDHSSMQETLLETSRHGTRAASPTGRPSPSSSSAVSLLRNLTTAVRKPSDRSRFKSLRRPRGVQYDTLGDNEIDQVPVDISSLAGLGFELKNMDNARQYQPMIEDRETAYMSPTETSHKPSFQSFVSKRRTVGDGMIIGARLRRDLSNPGAQHTSLSADGVSSAIERTKTVRNIGKSLAEKNNVIVAVSEAVDLSSLEGHSIRHRASQTFDTMRLGSRSMDDGPQSYFFPKDPDVPNWRPISMTSYYILILTAGAIGLAVFQEYLCRMSQRMVADKTGILAYDRVKSIPVWKFFAWKCKGPYALSSSQLTVARLAHHDHNHICRVTFYHGL